MKEVIQKISYLTVFLLIGTQLAAQNGHIRSEGYWTLGLNGGWAYQQADAQADYKGYGVGLTLAKNLYSRPGAPLSFDLRGRFLYANTYGLDSYRSTGIVNNESLQGMDYATEPGYVYYNHNTKIGELALEGVLHLNRLRERSQFDISVFGGVGLDYYYTKNNWLGVNGTYANDFSNIDANAGSISVRNTLDATLDNSYETRADGFGNGGKINIMPSLGAELYYWFTPKFALGLGHKATWARADDLDGQQWSNDNTVTAENDLYHYTHIGAKWILEPGRRRVEEPFINITDPQMNPFASPTQEGFVRAEVGNADKDQVRCFVNGRSAKFDMYGESFSVNFPLRAGSNEVRIVATNEAGRAEALQVITFQDTYMPPAPTAPSGDRPFITFRNPSIRTSSVNAADFRMEALVENVSSSNDISVLLNGQRVRNFNFDSRSNILTAPVILKKGENKLTVRAKNRVGSEKEDVFITYTNSTAPSPTQQRPTVKITRPNNDSYKTDKRIERVEATITNIDRKSDVRLFIKGRVSDSFQYNTRTGRFSSDINLDDGQNIIRIEANNGYANADDAVTIIYEQYTSPPPPPLSVTKPNVRITSVATPRPSDCQTTVKATITNVNSFRDVSFKVNGQRVTNFQFNPNTNQFTSTINVREGNNTILIEARNNGGKASDSDSVRCTSTVTSGGGQNNKPSVTITTPNQQSTTTSKAKASIKATIKDVDSKNDITFLVNGKRNTNFTYSTNTDKFSATADLKSGNNDIIIKAVNKYGKGEDNAAIRYIRQIGTPTVPKPPTVTITKPSNNSTVTMASTQVKATIKNITSKSGISLKVNEQNISNFTYANGNLSANVNLKEGNNTIIVKVQNTDGQDDAIVNVKYNKPVSAPAPTVAFTSPRNNATVEIAQQTINATVKNAAKSDLTFTLNGNKITAFSLSGTRFTTSVSLKKGRNSLQLKATNAGGSDVANLVIIYKEKVVIPKPTAKFTNPARPGSKVTNAVVNIVAIIKNVSSKSGITMKLNGIPVRGLTFTPQDGVVKARLNLKKGNNKIELVARNTSGTGMASTTITYEEKVVAQSNPPTVTIESASQPTINPMDPSVGRSSVIATIKNVKDKNAINFTVNGKKIMNFEFNLRSGFFKAVVDLERGTNAIKIQASNADGVASDTATVEF